MGDGYHMIYFAYFLPVLLQCCYSLSLWRSGSVQDSQLAGPVSLPVDVSHCMIEAGEMCKLMVALTSGRLVH